MNPGKREKLLGVLVMAAVGLLACDRLVLTPLTRLWKERTEQIAHARKSVEQGTQLLTRDKVIHARWDQMRTNTLSAETSKAENQILQAFYRWSQDSRIGINGIKPQWKHASDDYATLECRVDASGSLAEITRFLYEIEKDPLGVKLDIVEISARDDRGQQLALNLQVSGLQLNSTPSP